MQSGAREENESVHRSIADGHLHQGGEPFVSFQAVASQDGTCQPNRTVFF